VIEKHTYDVATQMGIKLSRVSIVEGRRVGCADVHLLNLAAGGQRVSTLVYQSELDELQSSVSCERLEMKIRTALLRLQMLLEP